MPVPDFQSFMRPVLQLTADGREHSLRELQVATAKTYPVKKIDHEFFEEE